MGNDMTARNKGSATGNKEENRRNKMKLRGRIFLSLVKDLFQNM